MSTRSTIWMKRLPFIGDVHVYRDYGQWFVEFGEPYSLSTFELPCFWRRRFRA
jgi:hypothetical protein